MPDTTPSILGTSVESLVARFESLWLGGRRQSPEEFLRDCGVLAPSLRLEVIHADLELRLKAGEPARIEEYLLCFPDLSDRPDDVLGLVLAEWRQRRRRESPGPDPAEYEQRFPFLAGRLEPPTASNGDTPRGIDAVESRPGKRPTVPGYEILDELGKGGMGVVYRARHLRLGRVVALKMIRDRETLSPDLLARFETEAEALARLSHPNIVQVYEVGEAAGQPYIALEYVEGGSLAVHLGGVPQEPREAALLVRTLAQALAAAHGKGVIHRDLKPANVLLQKTSRKDARTQSEDEQPSTLIGVPSLGEIVPKVTDFGLAKQLDVENGQTRSGQILGTPSYMAPEQAAGDVAKLDARVDVYALGAILYECLTGRPPFKAATVLDTLQQVREQDPVAVRSLQPKAPRDLETICLKCLRKEPGQRYASAGDLADDLGRWLEGRPIHARPVGTAERLWRWCRRNPAAAALIATPFVVLLAVVGILTERNARISEEKALVEHEKNQATEARTTAENERNAANDARDAKGKALDRADRTVYATRSLLAQREVQRGNVSLAKLLLEAQMPEKNDGVDRRGWEWPYLQRLCDSDLRTIDAGAKGWLLGVAISPDGGRIATCGEDGQVRVWDSVTGKQLLQLPTGKYPLFAIAFSPDGRLIAAGGGDQSFETNESVLKLWDTRTGEELTSLRGHPSWVTAVVFSPDGKLLASGAGQEVRLWDVETRKKVRGIVACDLPGPGTVVTDIAFSPDGRRLATAGADPVAKIWEVATGKLERECFHPDNLSSVAFSADGRLLATGCHDGAVRVWDVADGRERRVCRGHTEWVNAVAFLPDDGLFSAGMDGTLRAWDTETGKELHIFRGHERAVKRMAVERDGWRIVSVGDAIRIWDAHSDLDMRRLPVNNPSLTGRVLFSADGRRLIAPDQMGWVLWEPDTGKVTPHPGGHLLPITDLALSPDGRMVATASFDETVKIWDVETGKILRTLSGHSLNVSGVAFSPDGSRVATSSIDGTVRLWEVKTGKELRALRGGKKEGFNCVAFSPLDGRLVAGDSSEVLRVWEPETGELVRELPGEQVAVNLAFGQDGKWLAVGGAVGSARIIDWASGEVVQSFRGNIWCWDMGLAVAPVGPRLFTGGERSIKVWDPATGLEVLTFTEDDRVLDLALSPDGHRLAVLLDKGMKLYDARPLTPELREEREAFGLTRFLQARPLLRAGVEKAVKEMPNIGEGVRQQALALAGPLHDEPGRFRHAAWKVARQAGLPAETYRAALPHAETALRLAPNDSLSMTAMGVLLFRLGDDRKAVEVLEKAYRRNGKSAGLFSTLYEPRDVAFLAMAYHRLGEKDKAAKFLQYTRASVKHPEWKNDLEARGFLAEAEAMIEPASKP